jgi:hypothetical protein
LQVVRFLKYWVCIDQLIWLYFRYLPNLNIWTRSTKEQINWDLLISRYGLAVVGPVVQYCSMMGMKIVHKLRDRDSDLRVLN